MHSIIERRFSEIDPQITPFPHSKLDNGILQDGLSVTNQIQLLVAMLPTCNYIAQTQGSGTIRIRPCHPG